MGEVIDIRPQPGPQEDFLATEADVCFTGGAAGSGKSYGITIDPIDYLRNVPGFTAIIFRRTSPQLTGAGSLWEEAGKVYPNLGGTSRAGQDLDWRWDDGGTIQYRHLQHEKNVLDHQGKQYCGIYFDELTHFSEAQFWYMMSRNRSICGVRPYVRGSCNPDPDSWVRKMLDWWIGDDGYAIPERSGVLRYFLRIDNELVWADTAEELEERFPAMTTDLIDEDTGEYPRPKSFTFIPGKLTDNKILMKADPGYMANLLALPLVEREQLLNGNWDIKPAAGLYFQRRWFEVLDAVPAGVVKEVRGWDLAASKVTDENPDPDFSATVKIVELRDGRFMIVHFDDFRESPLGVENAIVNTASQDSPRCIQALWQDPGGAGKADVQHKVRLLKGRRVKVVTAAKDKVTYAGPLSAQAEVGNVLILRADWNDRFFRQAEAFPEGAHDDGIDAASRAFMELSGSGINEWVRNMQAAKAA